MDNGTTAQLKIYGGKEKRFVAPDVATAILFLTLCLAPVMNLEALAEGIISKVFITSQKNCEYIFFFDSYVILVNTVYSFYDLKQINLFRDHNIIMHTIICN